CLTWQGRSCVLADRDTMVSRSCSYPPRNGSILPMFGSHYLRSAIIWLPVLLAGCGKTAPEAGTEPWPVFSATVGSNALDRVVRFVEIRPRDAGTQGGAYAAQWIAQELRAAGLSPK